MSSLLKFAIELQAVYLRRTTDAIIWDYSGGDAFC